MTPPISHVMLLLAVFIGIAYALWRMWRSMRLSWINNVSDDEYLPHTCRSCGRGLKEAAKRCPACRAPSEDYADQQFLKRLRTTWPKEEAEPVPPVEGEAIVSVHEEMVGGLDLWIEQFTARGIWCQEKINVIYMPRGGRSEHHHLMVRKVDEKRARRLVRFFKTGKGLCDGK